MKTMRNFKIKIRLWLLTILALAGVFMVAATSLMVLHSALMQEKEDQTRKLVETAYSILVEQHDLIAKGELDETTAKASALKIIKGLRYDGDNYFWINDMHPTMVMHPIKPALDGQDLSAIKDPSGKKLFMEFVEAVKDGGAGFVPYLWPKPGAKDPVAKLSYVKAFKPWGWIIGSGIYIDDVEATFWKQVFSMTTIVVVILVLLSVLSFAITMSILRPLRKTTAAMDDISQGEGDLTARLDSSGNDEISELALAFNRYTEKIHEIISQVRSATGELTSSATELNTISAETNSSMMQQRNETQQAATAVTEMASTVKEIAKSSEAAAVSASEADQEAIAGKSIVGEAAATINKLASEVEQSSEVINRLENESDAIGSVLDVIRGIAEQTNLLALNAAIEAARAGEQGRGFAVVADEVRTLASRTQQSTQEIQQMIEKLQTGSREAVRVMDSSRVTTQHTVEKASEAADSLNKIAEAVAIISDMNRQIATAAEEQAAVAQEIDSNIVRISDLAENGAENTTKVSSASEKLSGISGGLEHLVQRFKV
jgi:methyl-accepting chemotaxis protein